MKAILSFVSIVVMLGVVSVTANVFIMIDEGIRSMGTQKVESNETIYGHRIDAQGNFVILTTR